jgi:hypothetical protein
VAHATVAALLIARAGQTMRLTRRSWLAGALCAWGLDVRAQSPSEARVKARLALALVRFTQWPNAAFAGPAEPLVMCVASRSAVVAEAFTELAGQTAAGRPIRIVQTTDKSHGGCHVLFLHDSVELNAAMSSSILASLGALPVLTIGDAEGFSARGGMVELVNVNDTTRLDVNLKTLRAAQLSLSSQVLKLARQVRE